jgi:hypothetical protein
VTGPGRLANLRDAGGAPVAGGGRVCTGVLLRSDAPHPGDAPPEGVAWPPRTVVDLRSADEHDGTHPLVREGAEVLTVALSGQASVTHMVENLSPPGPRGDDLVEIYRRALRRRGRAIARAAEAVATAPGPVLVHCTAGKDRTGMVVATVLAAVGVGDDDIVADYLRTQEHMPGVLDRIASDPSLEDGAEVVRELLDERPGLAAATEPAIREVLAILEAAPGGAAGYLASHGLGEDGVVALRERLVDRA